MQRYYLASASFYGELNVQATLYPWTGNYC